jgi:hypothetical protein
MDLSVHSSMRVAELVDAEQGHAPDHEDECGLSREGNQIRVRLVKENTFGDTFYAWKLWDCGTVDQTRSWSSNQTGNFHFDLEKNDTTSTYYAWTVYGNTVYP